MDDLPESAPFHRARALRDAPAPSGLAGRSERPFWDHVSFSSPPPIPPPRREDPPPPVGVVPPRGPAAHPVGPAGSRELVSFLDLAAVLTQKPVTVLLHGTSRELVNLVTYGLVAWTGSEYTWIDVRLETAVLPREDPVHLGVIAPERLVVVHRLEEMAPNEVGQNIVGSMLRSDEPRDAMAQISEFVRLPRPVQLAIARTLPGPTPGILVVSNAHRLMALYDASVVPEMLREVVVLGASIFVSFGDEPPARRTAFDFVLRVIGGSAAHWPDATLEFERTPSLALQGRKVKLNEIGPIAHWLSAALE